MSIFEKFWIEFQKHSSAFSFSFEIPVSNLTWKDKIIEFDLEFLIKGEKYGLFYFMDNVLKDYLDRRRAGFSEIKNNYISLLSFENYFPNENRTAYKFIEESYINLPYRFDGRMICKPTKYHRPFLDLQILDVDNFPGIDLLEFKNSEIWDGILVLSIDSWSNIWWEELLYIEDNSGSIIYKGDSPQNNRPWAYRISPRFNSFLRDLTIKTMQLGGSRLMENYNKKYVTEEGILLDGNIIYQEDIDEGRIDLSIIDNHPA